MKEDFPKEMYIKTNFGEGLPCEKERKESWKNY